MKTLKGVRTPFKYRTSFIFSDKFKQGWFLFGVVVFVGWLNDLIYFHLSYLTGGIIVLLFAYLIRFLAVGNGAIKSGISRIHPNIVDSSLTMGVGFYRIIIKIICQLIHIKG